VITDVSLRYAGDYSTPLDCIAGGEGLNAPLPQKNLIPTLGLRCHILAFLASTCGHLDIATPGIIPSCWKGGGL